MSADAKVVITPYVSSAILEHAKRKRQVTGFLIGYPANNKYFVVDYIPMTVSSSNRMEERKRLARARDVKSSFVKGDIIGWYSAGWPEVSVENAEEAFHRFCEAPGHILLGKGMSALHLHCALPEASRMSVQWTAYVTRNLRTDKDKYELTRSDEQLVSIAVEDNTATNVVLNHVRDQLLYAGQSPYPREALVNLDEVARKASQEGKSIPESLLAVEKQVQQLLSQEGGDDVVKASLETLRQTREEQLERQLTADDVVTQHLKEALIIKCMAVLLQEHVYRIEVSIGESTDDRRGAILNNNHKGNNFRKRNFNNNHNKR